jgi:protein O-mannosyl-transferase
MPRSPIQPPRRAFRPLLDWAIGATLVAATFLVYAQTARFDFVNFDDPQYVTANPHVRAGLTRAGAVWAFTSGDDANWFPLTRLSHMLDSQLFGVNAGPQHIVNVLLHALAALLLFAFLRRATRARWPSAFVALLFALHPLHVESVAWISERKDVLSACFWFLALWAYAHYAGRRAKGGSGLGWYLVVALAFAFGLMSKPMIVTLPLVLLLLDAWPFDRLRGSLGPVLLEKIPLFTLAAAGAAATYLAQRHGGAVQSFSALPLGLRLENALVSYITYIAQTFWPSGLAIFYPHPPAIPVWQAIGAALALAAISALVLRHRAARPYLAVGWSWFLGTLVPVIGLVQVGSQARADRYMYVPMAGLGIMLAWGALELVRRRPRAAVPAAVVGCASCAAMMALSWVQTGYWANSETLFRRALAVTHDNYLAHYNLGVALQQTPGHLPEAISEFQATLRIQPDHAAAHNNLGNALSKIPGRLPEAVAEYRAALRLQPDYAAAHNNLGSALEDVPGGLPEAIAEYQTALRLQPDNAAAYNNLGDALLKAGRPAEAATQLETALRLDPDYASAHNNLGLALSRIPGRLPDAIEHFQAAVRLNPRAASAHVNLGSALAQAGRLNDAVAVYQTALRIAPDSAPLHNNLGNAWSKLPDHLPEAISEYQAALRLNPRYADAHYNLAIALAKSGRLPDALAEFDETLRLRPNPQLRQIVDRLRARP